MKTAEERGREFLEFIAENVSRLRWNLSKNVIYDPNYFDDVFGYTVLRVYDAITERGLEVQDYEQYFFNASRLNYIKIKERADQKRNRNVDISDAPEIKDEPEDIQQPNLSLLKDELRELFGEVPSDIFFRFMKAKAENGDTYQTFAEREGMNAYKVSEICSRIKRYLRN